MTKPEKLNHETIDLRLLDLNTAVDNPWKIEDGQLFITYKFQDFVKAFAFMTAAALNAEKLDHHPDWSNSYNEVTIRLSTHEIGGISDVDFKLAGEIQKLAESFSCI